MEKVFLAIGFFDGVHKGHLRLLYKAMSEARLINCKTAVFTFNDDFFRTRNIQTKLIDLSFEKEEKLKNIGIDYVYFASPTVSFLNMTVNDFHNFLLTHFNLAGVVVGSDFRYGKNAQNSANELADFLSLKNITTFIEPLFKINNAKVSSETIRTLINNGKIEEANQLLYRKYSIDGTVIKGRGEGRKYGIKTANIEVSYEKVLPSPGVYLTKTYINNDQTMNSLTHIGPCPTFNYYKHTIETFITNFNKDIYGKTIRIEFIKKIRENIKFENKMELKKQIEEDLKHIINLN